jgi:hypothetical protein
MSYWIKPGITQETNGNFHFGNSLENMPTSETILTEVCRLTATEPDDIKSKSRKQDTVIVRQMYCYVARKLTGATMEEIGNVINRNHATVTHSCKVIEQSIFIGDRIILTNFENLKIYFGLKIPGGSKNPWRDTRRFSDQRSEEDRPSS